MCVGRRSMNQNNLSQTTCNTPKPTETRELWRETYPSSSSCSGRIRCVSCSLYPQNEIGPSISSSVVLCVFVLLVYIVMLVYVTCLFPSSVRVVATFPGTVLFPLLYYLLPFFPLTHWFFSLSSFVIPRRCLKNLICAASKRCSSLFFSTQASLPNFKYILNIS